MFCGSRNFGIGRRLDFLYRYPPTVSKDNFKEKCGFEPNPAPVSDPSGSLARGVSSYASLREGCSIFSDVHSVSPAKTGMHVQQACMFSNPEHRRVAFISFREFRIGAAPAFDSMMQSPKPTATSRAHSSSSKI